MRDKKVLFICSRNKLRSPTAEIVFQNHPNVKTASAGLNKDSEIPVTPELLLWADVIFVMENAHRAKLSKNFKPFLKKQQIINLNVPDKFEFMDPDLIRLLELKVPSFLQ